MYKRQLLLCTVIATVGFAFPRLVWATYIGYSLIALLLTQVMVGSSNAPNWSDALYRGLGLMAVVTRFDSTKRVTEALLMGATAGYLHIGLAAGLVMSALETIQPGSFQPLEMANVGDSSVLASARLFRPSTTTPSSASPPSASGTSARCSPCHGW